MKMVLPYLRGRMILRLFLHRYQRLLAPGGMILLLIGGCGAPQTVQNGVTSGATASVSLPLATPTRVVPSPVMPSPVPPNTDWETDWLRGQPCAPPCFAGIVPGTTMLSETVRLLETNPHIAYVKVFSDTTLFRIGEVRWGWRTILGGGVAAFTPTIDRITRIGVDSTPIRLDTLMTAYGDPSDVIALRYLNFDETVTYSLWIVYRDRGLIMPVLSSNIIAPATMLGSPRFFEANPQGLVSELEGMMKGLVPWAGYQPLAFYCRDSYTGLPCEP